MCSQFSCKKTKIENERANGCKIEYSHFENFSYLTLIKIN